MTWFAVVAGVLAGWVMLSLAVALLFGQAVRMAERRRPRRPSAERRAAVLLDRVVEIATGAIPIIRPRLMEAVTGAIPIIRPRAD